MINSDKGRFATLMLGIAEYYNESMSSPRIEIYWEALKDFDIDSIDRALKLHLRSDSGQFMPKVADIFKLIEGTSSDTAIVAWTKVEKAISRVGAYASVVFDDAIIQKVISDMGSWSGLCHKNVDEMPFVAKEFQQRYRHYKTTGKVTNHPKVLIGLAEAANQLQGFKSEPPVLVGDIDSAMLVMNNGSNEVSIGFSRLALTNDAVS